MAQVMQRRRRWVLMTLGVLVVVGLVLGILSGFYVDLLWFREVGFSTVFWSVFWSKVLLGTLFGSLFFVLLFANLLVAQRLAPRFRPFSPEQELIDRYRSVIEPHARVILLGFSALIAMFVGIAASGQWETFLVWRSTGDVAFGPALADGVFGRDPAFYLFILPFHKFVQGWLFSALVGVTVIVALTHYLTGGIRTQTVGEKVTPQVKVHLSVLLGVIVLTKAWGYWLGRFDLLLSPRGTVTGASYTDVHAHLPALRLLVFIAIACAALFLVNIRFRGWALPAVGIGLLALVSVVAGAIFPAAVQSISVNPQELDRERQFIQRNIDATRFAFGLDAINVSQEDQVGERVTAQDVEDNQATVDNIRLWSPEIVKDAYLQLERIQPYYEFYDVDVDRYDVRGDQRVVMLAPREVSQNGIEGGGATWQNQHLVYTHGFGAVASQVNSATAEGAPVFLLQNIPPVDRGISLPPDEGAQLYYGELDDVRYVVVGGRGQQELNFPNPSGAGLSNTTYQGEGGISIGSFFRRLVFAYRYRDFNLMISSLINDESKILINRSIYDRVRKAAPFLLYDRDPYTAIVDGRVVWIWDAYTATDRYPYSQRADLRAATGELIPGGRVNYLRNSVKAVVDAYDGTVTFYVVDPEDPMIQVWMRAFPDLFTIEPAPEEIQAHFRYPENLLQIQAAQFANYHIDDADIFYRRELPWAVPHALPDRPQGDAQEVVMRPYYVLTRLPGDEEESFVLFMPLTPFNRPNMVAFMAARSDPGENYGQVEALEFIGSETVDGPQQVRVRIDNDPEVAREITLLGQQGSAVKFGDLLVVPIEDSFLYVQPIFVESTAENTIPELKRIAVLNGGRVAISATLQGAIEGSITGDPGDGGGDGGLDEVAELLAAAQDHFDAAQAALLRGDLATYQREIDAGVDLVRRAAELSGATPEPTPTPSPT